MVMNLTAEGQSALLDCLEDASTIVFKEIALGSGSNAGESATALSKPVKVIPIHGVTHNSGNDYVTLTSSFDNSDVSTSFHATETGVFIQSPSDSSKEILFAYGYVDSNKAVLIPSSADCLLEMTEKIMVYVGSNTNVDISLSDSLTIVTKEDLNNAVATLTEEDDSLKQDLNDITADVKARLLLLYKSVGQKMFLGDLGFQTSQVVSEMTISFKVNYCKVIRPASNDSEKFYETVSLETNNLDDVADAGILTKDDSGYVVYFSNLDPGEPIFVYARQVNEVLWNIGYRSAEEALPRIYSTSPDDEYIYLFAVERYTGVGGFYTDGKIIPLCAGIPAIELSFNTPT